MEKRWKRLKGPVEKFGKQSFTSGCLAFSILEKKGRNGASRSPYPVLELPKINRRCRIKRKLLVVLQVRSERFSKQIVERETRSL